MGNIFVQEKPATVRGFYQKLLCMQKLATRTDAEHTHNLLLRSLQVWKDGQPEHQKKNIIIVMSSTTIHDEHQLIEKDPAMCWNLLSYIYQLAHV